MIWTYVPTVAPGDLIDSRQALWLAQALNERLRWTVPHLYLYWLHAFRSMRLGSQFLFPSEIESLVYYLHASPEMGQWPLVQAGEPEGANRANVINLFVFGDPDRNFGDEAARLDVPLWINGGPPQSPADMFWLAAQQRGILDPDSGAYNAPALSAARSHFGVRASRLSPYGNDYGGFKPQPELADPASCPDGFPSYKILFSSLTDPPEDAIQFPGTCPGVQGHVAYVSPTAWAYYVYTYDSSGDAVLSHILPANEWVEGPYEGTPYLMRSWGDHIHRLLLFPFVKEFRGNDAQRAERANYYNQEAFDFQGYLTSQNQLLPQLGHVEGTELVADLPTVTWSASAPAGAYGLFAGGASSHSYTPGFVIGAALLQATGLQAPVTIEFLDSANQIGSVTLEPDTGGAAQHVLTWPDGPSPYPLRIRLSSDLQLAPAGQLQVVCTQILQGKPDLTDAYLLLRLAATQEGRPYIEGQGIDYGDSRVAWLNYRDFGVIHNTRGEAGVPIQDSDADGSVTKNPLYQAARRLARSCLRVVPPRAWGGGQNIIEAYYYEEGRPVLICRRHLSLGGQTLDLFEGMIDIQDAPARGLSNHWYLQVNPRLFRDVEGSQWHPEVYGDRFGWINRCHVYPSVLYPPELRWHWNYGVNFGTSPESVPGHNYVRGVNRTYGDPAAQARFCASCRIWEPAVPVQSCEAITEGGVEKVKITLAHHLHRHPNAPSSVPRNPGDWTADDLARLRNTHASEPEDFRTDDNALREWALRVFNGTNPVLRPGDHEITSAAPSMTGPPYGAAWPYLVFVRQVPAPYQDDNQIYDSHDTQPAIEPMEQAELYLRGICSAFVDGETTAALACRPGATGLYDYTWESLLYQANGNRWTPLLPIDVRPDNPQGFGPLPNTLMYAESFNALARIVNRLDKLRMDIPYEWETRDDRWSGVVDAGQMTFGNDNCSLNGNATSWKDGVTGPTADTPVPNQDEWISWGGLPPVVRGSYTVALSGCDAEGTGWLVTSHRIDDQYRLSIHAAYDAAVPSELRALWDEGFGEVAAERIERRWTLVRTAVPYEQAAVCDGVAYGDGTFYYAWDPVYSIDTHECRLVPIKGTLTADKPDASDLNIKRTPAMSNGEFCADAAGHFVELRLYDPPNAYVRVPLQDPSAEEPEP